jgi:hypothetical protein
LNHHPQADIGYPNTGVFRGPRILPGEVEAMRTWLAQKGTSYLLDLGKY